MRLPDSAIMFYLPHYWREEVTGILVPVVEHYLNSESLTPHEVAIIRAYIRQWIMSPAWDAVPGDDSTRAELADLRAGVDHITDRRGIDQWLAIADEMAIDPL